MDAKSLMSLLRMEDALDQNSRELEAQRVQHEEALMAEKRRREELQKKIEKIRRETEKIRKEKEETQRNFISYLTKEGKKLNEIIQLTGLTKAQIKALGS